MQSSSVNCYSSGGEACLSIIFRPLNSASLPSFLKLFENAHCNDVGCAIDNDGPLLLI